MDHLVDMACLLLHSIFRVLLFWSALMQTFITKIAVGIYLYQLVLIHQTDFQWVGSKSHNNLQEANPIYLGKRGLFYNFPLGSFWWTDAFLKQLTPLSQSFYWQLSWYFTALAIWLFLNIRMENSEKPGSGWIFRGKEWEPLAKTSWEMLGEIVPPG